MKYLKFKANKNRLVNHFYLIVIGLACLALLGILALILYKATLTRFYADDFCMGSSLANRGFFASQTWWYINWTGRYSFTFLVHLFVMAGSNMPGLATIFFTIIFITSLFFSLITISIKKYKIEKITALITSLLITLSFFLTTILLLPDLFESYFWLSGALTYFAPISIFSFFIASLIYLEFNKQNLLTNNKVTVCYFIFGVVAGGFSEPYAFLFVIYSFTAAIIIFIKKYNINSLKSLLSFGFGSLLGFVILLLAPGNKVRRSAFPLPSNFTDDLTRSALLSSEYITKQIFNNKLVIITILAIAASLAFYYKNKIKNRSFILLILGTMAFLTCLITFLPSIYIQSTDPPLRVYIFPSIIIIIFIFSSGYMGTNYILGKLSGCKKVVLRLSISLLLAVLFTLLINSAYKKFFNEIKKDIKYAYSFDMREKEIISSNRRDVITYSLDYKDEVAPHNWIFDNKRSFLMQSFWKNECIRTYYGLNTFNYKY